MVMGIWELWIDGQFKQDYMLREAAIFAARNAANSHLYISVTLYDPNGEEVAL